MKSSTLSLMLALIINNDFKILTESKTIDVLKNVTNLLENNLTNENTTIDKINSKTNNESIETEIFFDKNEISDAVLEGFNMMQELYNVKEPLLYKMGFYLDPNEPAARLATFKTPNIKATLQSKYGFATVQATLRLAQRNPLQLGRQNEDLFEDRFRDLPNDILDEQCPFKTVPRCGLASKRYRTSDGTCNNPNHPGLGSALSPLQRFLPPVYNDGVQSERRSTFGSALPSSRLISFNIHQQRNVETSILSLMLMQWGQFLDHDITSTVSSRAFNASIPRCCLPGGSGFLPFEFLHPECMPISVPESDNFFNQFGVKCMEFVRSAPAIRINCKLGYREQINQATSFIDASMIYGSDVHKSESLRTFQNGQLFFGSHQNNCHFGAISSNCFSSGDRRFGEQPALTALHTIWVKFHNKIANELSEFNPHWSDEKIYQETRRIIAGLIQHITYREFLPIILGPEVIDLFELKLLRDGFYKDYDENVNPTTSNEFSTAAFRFGHSLVQNSFLRTTMNHRMIPDNVSIHEEITNFRNTLSPGSLHRLILGLINQPSQVRDEFISEELTRHLFQSPGGVFGVDLASVNIQRGRDHGLPPYTSWRVPCGLTPLKKWSDLIKVIPKETAIKFNDLYEDIDDIDLYTGGLSEKPVRGGIIGPVFACIIAQQFLNYRKGDRFWYENGGFESSFNLEQLNELRKVSLAEVICSVLKNVESIQNFVFLLVDDDKNPRISCDEIITNGLNLEYWRDDFEHFQLKDNEFDDLNRLKFKRNLNISENARNIGDYIMETIEDYYNDYDYEENDENRRKPTKNRKKNSKKPISQRPSTFPPPETFEADQEDDFQEILIDNQEITTKNIQFDDESTTKLVDLVDHEEKLTLIPLKSYSPENYENNNNDKDVLFIHNIPTRIKEKSNYQVNVHINYLLGSDFDKTTRKSILNENRPILIDRDDLDNNRPYLDNNKPHLDNNRPYLNNNRPNLDKNRPYLDNNRPNLDNNRPYLDNNRPNLDNNRPYLDNNRPNLDKNTPYLDNDRLNLDNDRLNLDNNRPNLNNNRPYLQLDNNRPNLDNNRPYLDNSRPNLDNNRPNLNNRPYLENNNRPYLIKKRPSLESLDTDKHYLSDELYLINENRPFSNDHSYLDKNRPDLDKDRFYLNKNRPHLNSDRPHIDNDRGYLTDRLYFDDQNKPYSHPCRENDQDKRCTNDSDSNLDKDKTLNLNQLVSIITVYKNDETTKKLNNYPIYLVNTKTTTTSKPNSYVTGYQIKKTTTAKDFYDVPVFISSNKNKFTTRKNYFMTTTKTYVHDVGYDPVNDDFLTTKKPNFQNFPTDRPQFSNYKPFTTTRRTTPLNYYLYNSQSNYAKDPIDDVYATILKKPQNAALILVNNNNKQKIDNKLDFKSELLPNKLKTKDANLVKIYSVKSGGIERLESKESDMDEKILLPELDGPEIVHIEVLPSEIKFSSNKSNEGSLRQVLIPNINSFEESSDELPNQMNLKLVKRRRHG